MEVMEVMEVRGGVLCKTAHITQKALGLNGGRELTRPQLSPHRSSLPPLSSSPCLLSFFLLPSSTLVLFLIFCPRFFSPPLSSSLDPFVFSTFLLVPSPCLLMFLPSLLYSLNILFPLLLISCLLHPHSASLSSPS